MRRTRGTVAIPKVHFTLPETAALTVELPDPPSVNHIWRQKKSGGVYLSPEYQAWKRQAEVALIGKLKAVRGPVVLTITIPDSGRRDLDNAQKVLIDLIVRHGIIEDDDRNIVREIRSGWGDVDRAIVEVRRAYDWIQRRDFASRQKERVA